MKLEPKAVLVVWEDAHSEDGPWVATDTMKPLVPMVFAQVGWLVEEDDSCVVLSSAVEASGDSKIIAARERIPRGMVRSVTELSPPKRKR